MNYYKNNLKTTINLSLFFLYYLFYVKFLNKAGIECNYSKYCPDHVYTQPTVFPHSRYLGAKYPPAWRTLRKLIERFNDYLLREILLTTFH